MRALLALFVFVMLLGGPARADELRPGYLELRQENGQEWMLVWKAPMRYGILPQTQPVLPENCVLREVKEHFAAGFFMQTVASVRCTGDLGGQQIGLSNFGGSQTDVLVRVAPLGRQVQALKLTATEPRAVISAKPSGWQVASTYFVTGVEHIIFGYDHLLFVVALVFLLGGLWPVAKAVTAFTVAHSITLIGTTLGLFGLPQRPVEAVIALSIIFLAVEIVKKEPGALRLSERIPWVMAFLFGLLHGFGFAGALREIGLPETDVPTALLTFNLGVEAGQLGIVLTTLAILALLARLKPLALRPVTVIATYAIGIIASRWFIERLVL